MVHFVHYTVLINTGKVDWFILEINIYGMLSLTRRFVYIYLNEVDVINLNLQVRKLKPREVK